MTTPTSPRPSRRTRARRGGSGGSTGPGGSGGSEAGIDPFTAARPSPPRPLPHPKGLVATGYGPATPSYGEPTGLPRFAPGRPDPGARRDPAALLAPVQRVTEPPAGLGAPPPSRPGAPVAWEPRPAVRYERWPLTTVIALGMVMLLGAVGAVVMTHRHAGGGQLVTTNGLSYRVPAHWTLAPGGPETLVNGVALDGVATGPRYVCGRGRMRATVGAAMVSRPDGADARTEDAARDFGPLFGKSFYGPYAETTASAPTPITVGALTGSASMVTVRAAAEDGCPGLHGQIRVLALPSTRTGQAGGRGVLMLVVQHDAGGGGPTAPAPVPERTVTEILSSVQVTER